MFSLHRNKSPVKPASAAAWPAWTDAQGKRI